jgi:hypothetical protein
VRAGSLDDTSWLRPTRHLWTRSKQPWVTFAEGDEPATGIIVIDIPAVLDCSDAVKNLSGLIELKT